MSDFGGDHDNGGGGGGSDRGSISPASARASSHRSRSRSSSRSGGGRRSRSSSAHPSHRSSSRSSSQRRSSSSTRAGHHNSSSNRHHKSEKYHSDSGHHHSKPHHDNNNNSQHAPGEPPSSYPPPERRLLPRLALPAAILIGLGIAAGTTYAVVAHVQNLIANAVVDGDLSKWTQLARTQAYDACYHGCANDCDDPNFAYNACQRTAQTGLGALCDANRMWNWADADRYPQQCLVAVAKALMGDALEDKKKSYRGQFGLIALTIVGGIVGAVVTYFLWKRFSMTEAERAEKKARKNAEKAGGAVDEEKFQMKRPSTWKMPRPKKKHSSGGGGDGGSRHSSERPGSRQSAASSSSSSSNHSRAISGGGGNSRPGSSGSAGSGNGKKATAVAAVLGLIGGAKPANAYACTGRDMAWNQYFVAPANNTLSNSLPISGVIHGWFSNCNDRRDCVKRCTDSCTTDSSGRKSCRKTNCSDDCHTTTTTDRLPKQYVDDVTPRVRACGFTTVDSLSSADMARLTVRIANANMERNLWVRISVNALNATRADRTDEMVMCLHDIGGH
ncbi:hypothetical protein B0H63DRAFT_462592 [Podospora didyma]|uniref:Uncharacterized protein n=1 Tax=Podospora didyma TaxID=330526 RepID=A0AAE0P839_9PEZI|nr:hypothetical protein B0H63DRAFT_462592 [Podospora didyma]